jgi:hypothetical protein
VTDASLEESKRIDEICHSHQPPIAFVRVETRGVFASVFCDYGPSFTVYDVDGEHLGSCCPSHACSCCVAWRQVYVLGAAAAAGAVRNKRGWRGLR